MYINRVPLWTMLLAGVLLHERLALPQFLGAGLNITGVYLATYHGRISKAASIVGEKTMPVK